ISIATVGVIQTVNNLSVTVLSKMLGASTAYADRATGVWHGSHLAVMLSGLASDGEYFVSLLTDTFAGSGGARARSDGIDLGGELPNVVSRWANVETQEHASPMRYLFRRPVPDSGGPGTWRGGVSHEFAFSVHDSAGENITVGLSAKGIAVPMSVGVFGGYPACTIGLELFRDANIDDLPESYDAVRGAQAHPVQWGEFNLGPRDVLYVRFMGGGGYGDPIDREPRLVAADVVAQLVSAQAAHDIYGVVLTETGVVDEGATARRRLGMRAERIGADVPAELGARRQVRDSGRPLGAGLQQVDEAVQCRWCGHDFPTQGGHWKDQAVRREQDTSAAGRFRESVEGLVTRQFFCPMCGTLLDTEVTLSTDPPLYDSISA
ncbi:MAG: hydantoinase B/oxoprolinase family protein, partial [Pseudonocardia sp.]|nr:hydantoinase B/oxoprolinase family protein [Pseudonocardia sp.]